MATLRKGIVLGALTTALVASVYAYRLAAGTLVIDGQSTPADIRTINGTAYVRLADVGKALDMSVVPRGGGRYELTKAGGANQIGKRAGKIGDTLFDGRWRLTVMSLETPSEYAMTTNGLPDGERDRAEWDPDARTFRPSRNHQLAIVRVRVANGTKERQMLWTAISDPKVRTAIADTDGGSHVPIAYDFAGGPTQTAAILPGASMTFNVVFSLPADARPKDLIFTLIDNAGTKPGNDVRIALSGGG